MITETNGANVWVRGYDWRNRMTSYNAPGTNNDATYDYDGLDRRISRTVNASLTKFIYDGNNIVADYNISDTCQASYVTPFLDTNLVVSRSNATYYYLHDGLGSVRLVVDTSSTVKNGYDYYGVGALFSNSETVTNRYKFTGRELDNESSEYYYRARYYRPSAGTGSRFTQRDPIGYLGGLNIYSYCENNAVNGTDPYGLFKVNRINKTRGQLRFERSNTNYKARGLATATVPYQPTKLQIKSTPDPLTYSDEIIINNHDHDIFVVKSKFSPSPTFTLDIDVYTPDPRYPGDNSSMTESDIENTKYHENIHYLAMSRIANYYFNQLEQDLKTAEAYGISTDSLEDAKDDAHSQLNDFFKSSLETTSQDVITMMNTVAPAWEVTSGWGLLRLWRMQAYAPKYLDDVDRRLKANDFNK
jgi:RHS repeat-associated protein